LAICDGVTNHHFGPQAVDIIGGYVYGSYTDLEVVLENLQQRLDMYEQGDVAILRNERSDWSPLQLEAAEAFALKRIRKSLGQARRHVAAAQESVLAYWLDALDPADRRRVKYGNRMLTLKGKVTLGRAQAWFWDDLGNLIVLCEERNGKATSFQLYPDELKKPADW
jgi:hypothetical protein